MRRTQANAVRRATQMSGFQREDDDIVWDNIPSPFEKLRDAALNSETFAIKDLGRVFRYFDVNGHQRLNYPDFCAGTRSMGLRLSSVETKQMFSVVDTNNSGDVDFDEFLEAVRPPINQSRRAIINLAFATLDQDEDDKITIEEMQNVYRARFDPKAKTGELTESQARDAFFRQFEGGRPGTVLTLQDFVNYYAGVSYNIEDDDKFVFLLKQTWSLR